MRRTHAQLAQQLLHAAAIPGCGHVPMPATPATPACVPALRPAAAHAAYPLSSRCPGDADGGRPCQGLHLHARLQVQERPRLHQGLAGAHRQGLPRSAAHQGPRQQPPRDWQQAAAEWHHAPVCAWRSRRARQAHHRCRQALQPCMGDSHRRLPCAQRRQPRCCPQPSG